MKKKTIIIAVLAVLIIGGTIGTGIYFGRNMDDGNNADETVISSSSDAESVMEEVKEPEKTTETEKSDSEQGETAVTEEEVTHTAESTSAGISVTAATGTQSPIQQPATTTASGNGNSPTPTVPATTETSSGESGDHAGQTWHPPVYEQVWIVDTPAWTEEIPVYETRYRDVCNQCGADITGNAVAHISNPDSSCGGYHLETYQVQVGSETVTHPAEGHYEEVLVHEGYWG